MRPKSPKEIKRAIVLRSANYTLAAIVEKTGISASTLQRIFRKYDIEKGALTSETIESARQQLLSDAGFISELKHQIAASVVDDLSLVRHVRTVLTLTLEELEGDTSTPATIKARSLASVATALKITQEVARRSLRADNNDSLNQLEQIPTLTITKMTDKEIRLAQDRFKHEDELESVTTD